MALQYITVSHEQEQATPVSSVRRSSRHVPPPTPATSSNASSASSEVAGVTRRTKRPPNPLTTLSPTPNSRKRSRPSSDLQDETEEEQQSSSPIKSSPFSRPQRRQRQLSSIIVPPTPEPTPRAIRAQKRRKLADETADAVATSAPSSSQPALSMSSASPSLSLPAPQPHPISPEPISPTNSSPIPTYVIKTRAGKRKTRQFDKEGSSETVSSSDSGDPLPRSLAKRRRIVRVATPRVSSTSSPGKDRSKSSTTATTTTTITRTRRKQPRGINTSVHDKQVRRSARLQSSLSPSQSPDTLDEPPASNPIVAADLPLSDDVLSIPMSPLTPPPDDDSRPPSPEPEPEPEQPLPSSVTIKESSSSSEAEAEASTIQEAKPTGSDSACTETAPSALPTQVDAEVRTGDPQEDEEDMEMIASIRTSSYSVELSSISPSPATAAKFRSAIPAHISNPVLKGRLPPNPLVYNQFQLAAYARTKPNTPSPLSLYSYTGNTPPSSPALSATTALDILDDIPSLGQSAAAAFVEAEVSIFGMPISEQYQQFDQQQVQFFEHQAQQGQYANTSTTGYVQEGQQQPQSQSLEPQVYDHQPQQEYQQPQAQAAGSTSEPILDMSFMMDIHMQLQLQQMQMTSSTGLVNGFPLGVGNMMVTGTGSESNQIPATVNMQDVHLHQQPQPGQPQHIQDAQYVYTGFFAQEQMQQAEEQFGAYGQPQQQAVSEFSQQSQTQHQYGTPVQHHAQFQPQQDFQQQPGQFQPQYQQEYQHQEQPQQQASAGYEGYSASAQHHVYDASQIAPGYGQQQHFQTQQQVEVTAFVPSNAGYDGYTGQASTPTTTDSNDPAAMTSHYTLGMHNALVYFRQTLSRFHDQQQLAKREAEQAHTSQLMEFQRDKEEKKRRLKKTKLITRISSCSMSLYSAYRAKTLWSLACKARMWEVVRRYSSDLIREVTELSAREYHRRMGLRYPCLRRNRRVAKVHQEDDTPDDERKDASNSPVSPIDKDGLEDDDEFRKEKIFDFELLDDDDDEIGMEEVKKETGGGGGDADVDENGDYEMGDADEAYDDDEDDEDDDEEDTSNLEVDETDCDLDVATIKDPLFDPDLSMRIQPQGASSPSSVLESTFYVPPLDFMPLAIPQNSVVGQQDQQQPPTQDPEQTSVASLNRKLMVVQRPVLSLPPPGLSTLRPQALKLYNIDPVHAGRGTPSIRVRRELWAGGPLPPFPVIQARASGVDHASAGVSSDDLTNDAIAATSSTEVANSVGEINADDFAPGCVTTYYAFASDELTASNTTTAIEDTGSTPTLVRQVTESSSSSSAACAHPVDESAVSMVAHEEAAIGPEADNDTEFGDCAGSCCLSEKAKGKRRAVEEEKEDEEKGGVVRETGGSSGGFEDCFEGLVNGTTGDKDAALTSTPSLPQGKSVHDTLPQSPEDQTLHQTLHQTVELTPAIPERTPLRRRSVPGRGELLKVYAPPVKATPPMLPLARRPPRPLPLEDNPVLRSSGQPYHPVTPYSWEQVAEAIDLLACHGIDAASWADASSVGDLSTLAPTIVLSGTEVQPFHSSSSELSAALG